MQETINLIPQDERVKQVKTKIVKFSTILAIILLIIVGSIGGYFFFQALNLKNQISNHDENIAQLRNDIGKLADIEVNARNLAKKSSTLQTLFSQKLHFSKLLQELEDSRPNEIFLDSLSLGDENTINLSGFADNYNSIQDFTNRVLEKDVFTEVTLNSVGLESRLERVGFFLVIDYNKDLLHD